MAQHDMNIANQGFPATRADINNALQAIATNNSGTSAPSTTFANQWFYDTTNNKLFIRNEANNAYIQVAVLDQTNNEWQITTGQISASDGDGLVFKTDDGTTRVTLSDGGDVTFAAGTDIITASAGTSNVRVGVNAGNSIASGGNYNTVVGDEAGTAISTGDNNSLIGYVAGDAITTGGSNTAVGAYAMTTLTTGTDNVAVGTSALDVATTGSNNTAIGRNALGANTTASDSVAVGFEALLSETTGSRSTAVGYQALKTQNVGSTTQNTAVGYGAGIDVTTAINSTFVGGDAGANVTTGNKNTLIGDGAGVSITDGASNTVLGRFSGNAGGLDIRSSDDNIVLSDGDGNPRLLINASGDITNNMGNLSSHSNQNAGFNFRKGNTNVLSGSNLTPLTCNRIGNDGVVIDIRQADSREGTISVSGSTVSYNGFAGRHESSGISTDTERGTVVSTIDELDVYVEGTKEGQTRADHAKVKISDSVGDKRVYGVVDNFESSGKVNVTSVGIAAVKVTGSCEGGDLLESNGDGTAKVQSDDIVRSKTIGKVTIGNSNTSVKLVSCVMYCG